MAAIIGRFSPYISSDPPEKYCPMVTVGLAKDQRAVSSSANLLASGLTALIETCVDNCALVFWASAGCANETTASSAIRSERFKRSSRIGCPWRPARKDPTRLRVIRDCRTPWTKAWGHPRRSLSGRTIRA
jgi:hypothetical protein